ncbi:MAG: Uma2 family endonuclease [Spirochaetaceae bacterium]|jgi:Uma2 family endonuclease|nr:Uma2 family endonuclease [Spirochaetaceae bacterium]
MVYEGGPVLAIHRLYGYAVYMSDAALQEHRRWTYADYKDWDLAPGERYEIINGEAYAMAAPNTSHQSMLMELARQIANYLSGKSCKVYPAPFDVRLFYEEDESDDTVVQPDISIICDEKKRGTEGCWGAPDFVVEILSPSNTASEMQTKFDLYRQAGVREYWVLDGSKKRLHAYRFEGGKIAAFASYGADDRAPVGIFSDLTIEIAPVFAE